MFITYCSKEHAPLALIIYFAATVLTVASTFIVVVALEEGEAQCATGNQHLAALGTVEETEGEEAQ